jgi:hypothetical protein
MEWTIPGLDPLQGKRYFFLKNVQTGSDPHPAIY